MEQVSLLTAMTKEKYLFRLPCNIAGALLHSAEDYVIVDGFEVYKEMLDFHNTAQEIELFVSEHGFDVFVDKNYVIELGWLYEI